MTDCGPAGTPAQIHALRSQGADRVDPVGLHYLEVLSRRASTQQGAARHLLEDTLARALEAYVQKLEQRQGSAHNACATPVREISPLGELVHRLAQHPLDRGTDPAHEPAEARTELKSVRHFRGTWARLSAERQVTQALSQAPANAGPINSHKVVLRSLSVMRDIAPDYLNHFITYVDTLLCLNAAEKAPLPGARAAAGTGTSGKKPRTPGGRSR